MSEGHLTRKLSYGYGQRKEDLSRVEGKNYLLKTERQRLVDRGEVACTFEGVTIDAPRNRDVCAALEHVASRVARARLAAR